jgi:hypothetical protein
MTEEALAIRIRRIGVGRPAICGEVEKMRSTLENRRQEDGVAESQTEAQTADGCVSLKVDNAAACQEEDV